MDSGGRDDDIEAFVAARVRWLPRVAWPLAGDTRSAGDLSRTVPATARPKWPRNTAGQPEAYPRTALVHTRAAWWRRRGEVPYGEVPDTAGGFDAYDLPGARRHRAPHRDARRPTGRRTGVAARCPGGDPDHRLGEAHRILGGATSGPAATTVPTSKERL
ncbi:hypothetical protein ACLGI4_13810 [Streptomyces sp. HMX112]|uniref:hypothetical protein n=1 Tax=Streptomyces sp. HMX112 TaxID=3390850 RepID=UPI003A8088F7